MIAMEVSMIQQKQGVGVLREIMKLCDYNGYSNFGNLIVRSYISYK